MLGQASFYDEALDFRASADPPTMALKWLSELEKEVGARLLRRVKSTNPPPKAGWSWEKLLADEFGAKSGSKLPPEVAERARKEKADALATLYQSRFSVLCGRAGTGKTSVLKVLPTPPLPIRPGRLGPDGQQDPTRDDHRLFLRPLLPGHVVHQQLRHLGFGQRLHAAPLGTSHRLVQRHLQVVVELNLAPSFAAP